MGLTAGLHAPSCWTRERALRREGQTTGRGAHDRRGSPPQARQETRRSDRNGATATVHDNRDAVDEGRRAGAEKEHRVGDVVDRGQAPERTLRDRRIHRCRIGEALHALGTGGRSRRDAVHPNTVAAPFRRQRPRHRVHAGLRGRRVNLADRAQIRQRRADVDHAAAAHAHVRKRRAGHVERSLEIDVDDRAEAVRRQVLCIAHEVAGRAVDHDVETPERRRGLVHDRRDGSRVPHVSAERQCPDTRPGNVSRRGIEMLLLPAGNRHVAAMRRQRQRNAAADPRAATRDECRLPFQQIGWKMHGRFVIHPRESSTAPRPRHFGLRTSDFGLRTSGQLDVLMTGTMSLRSSRLTPSTIFANARATASSPDAGTTSGRS